MFSSVKSSPLEEVLAGNICLIYGTLAESPMAHLGLNFLAAIHPRIHRTYELESKFQAQMLHQHDRVCESENGLDFHFNQLLPVFRHCDQKRNVICDK